MPNQEIILITGSSGFIGSALAKQLATKYKIIGLDQGIPKNKITGVDYRILDISSSEKVGQVLKDILNVYGNRIHSVIHLVAYYSFSGAKSSKYQEITVEGTKNLITQLKNLFAVEQFIFSSTMLVHAPVTPGEEINEFSPVKPAWPYPQSKVDAEKAIRENCGNVPVVNLRIAGVYDDYCHSIPIAQHIVRVYEMQFSSLMFPGNATHGQAFLHLDDLISAMQRLIEKRKQLPAQLTLLLGEDNPLSYGELQAHLGRLIHHHNWPVVRIPAFIAKTGARLLERLPLVRDPFIKPWMIPFADEHYDLNIENAARVLDWKPAKNLLQTLTTMVASLKNDPHKWYSDHKIKEPFYRQLPIDESEEKTYRMLSLINVFLGLWLISNPFTVGTLSSMEFWHGLISGTLITFVAAFSFVPTLRWLRWLNVAFASWLIFSPLAFWTTSSAVYSNDTLIGTMILLVSAFTPSRLKDTPNVNEIPTGWNYNPSSWIQRLPIMMIAFIGFLLARYLAAFQLGHIEQAWDPFFADGTEKILRSDISKAFPISDAGLGAYSYLLDVVATAIGDRRRWQTMPWMVILFGFFIIPTGVTSIVLVMLQPIGVGAWCTICLITAFIMLLMVPPAIDEVIASIQYLKRSVKAGKPFWRTFWFGGEDEKNPTPIPLMQKSGFPVHLFLSLLIGLWFLFAPWALGISGMAANNIYISAALIVTFAVISFSEVARITRLLNLVMGTWLIFSVWFVGDLSQSAQWICSLSALALILLSLRRGKAANHFGSFDKWARWKFKFESERYGEKMF